MTPEEALAGALRLLDTADTTVDGARLAAFVARQALEQLVDERCRALDADCPDASMRSKLVVLRALGDQAEADAAHQAWSGLSVACHRHPYELEPAGSEVRDLCAAVMRLVRTRCQNLSDPRGRLRSEVDTTRLSRGRGNSGDMQVGACNGVIPAGGKQDERDSGANGPE